MSSESENMQFKKEYKKLIFNEMAQSLNQDNYKKVDMNVIKNFDRKNPDWKAMNMRQEAIAELKTFDVQSNKYDKFLDHKDSQLTRSMKQEMETRGGQFKSYLNSEYKMNPDRQQNQKPKSQQLELER